MLTFEQILYGMGLPFVLSAVLFVLAWLLSSPRSAGCWAGALAIPAGFALADFAAVEKPPFPPIEGQHFLFFLCIPLVLWSLVDAVFVPARRGRASRFAADSAVPTVPRGGSLAAILAVRAISALALSVPTTWFLLHPIVQYTWSRAESVAYVGAFSILIPLAFIALDQFAARRPGLATALILALTAGSTGIVLATSGSIKYGQLGLALTATVAPAAILAIWARRWTLAPGAILPFTLLHLSLLLLGYYLAEVTKTNAILLAVAPHCAWLTEIPALRRIRPGLRGTIAVTLVAIPLVIAVALALIKFHADAPELMGG